MGKPKAPEAPDPQETAAAQTGTNVATALANASLNQYDSFGPDGSTTYSQTGTTSFTDPVSGQTYDIPRYAVTEELSEGQQQIYDQNQAANQNLSGIAQDQSEFLRGYLSEPVNFDGLSDYGSLSNPGQIRNNINQNPNLRNFNGDTPEYQTSYIDDFSADRQRVEDSLNANLDRQHSRDEESLNARLADQGIQLGSEAYSRAHEDFQNSKDRSRLDATLTAGAEQTRLAGLAQSQAAFGNQALGQSFSDGLTQTGFNNQAEQQRFNNSAQNAAFQNSAVQQRFNQDLTAANFQNDLRERELQQTLTERNQPLNEISALTSGSQVSRPQQYQGPNSQIATTDYAGLVQQGFNNQQQVYQNQLNQWNQGLGGAFGLGSTLIASDRRLKNIIRPLGKLKNGLTVYLFKYIGEKIERVGLMAQEVAKLKPEAIVHMDNGFMAVDYGKASAS